MVSLIRPEKSAGAGILCVRKYSPFNSSPKLWDSCNFAQNMRKSKHGYLAEMQGYPHNILPYFKAIYYNVVVLADYTSCVVCGCKCIYFLSQISLWISSKKSKARREENKERSLKT